MKLIDIADSAQNRLFDKYCSDIRSWDWQGLRQGTEKHYDIDEEMWTTYLGDLLYFVPSGKCYTWWTTNQNTLDETLDTLWFSALEEICQEKNCIYHASEGSATDLMLSWPPS